VVQTICAFRLLAPEIELSLSTRESPWFRDHVIPLAINNVSAFSKPSPVVMPITTPNWNSSPRDDRRPEAVAEALMAQGLQPVWKDWDSYLGRAHRCRKSTLSHKQKNPLSRVFSSLVLNCSGSGLHRYRKPS
jgi:2-iminoacetate synthase